MSRGVHDGLGLGGLGFRDFGFQPFWVYIVNHRKLEYEFVMFGVGIPFVLPQGHEGNDVQTFLGFCFKVARRSILGSSSEWRPEP